MVTFSQGRRRFGGFPGIAGLKAALLASVMLPGYALAQDAPAGKTSVAVEEVIVTAQKREERLSKVPIAIAAVSGDQLAVANVISPADLQQMTPGVVTNSSAHTGSFWLPYIRGIGSNSTVLGNNSSVATYIDGVYQPALTPNVADFASVERIEVIKGPQGTLFGRNATGGAISIVTKAPSFTPIASGEASYGRFDESVVKFYGTGPIVANKLAGSVSAQFHNGGDYIRNIYDGDTFGGYRSFSLSGKLLWTPTDRLKVTATALYAVARRSDSSQSLAFAPEWGVPTAAAIFGGSVAYDEGTFGAGFKPQFISKSIQGILDVRYSFDAFDLVSITGYQHANDDIHLDYDTSTANVFFFNENDYISAFSQELQFVSTTTGRLKWVAGLFYSSDIEQYNPLTFGQGIPFPGTPEQVALSGGTKAQINATSSAYSYAVFGQATYEVFEGTNLTLGARYTSEQKKLRGLQYLDIPNASGGFDNFIVPPGVVDTRKQFQKPTWRASLDHSFSDDLMVYVSYNRGFKSGAYNPTSITSPPVNPEVLDAYEVGMKGKAFAGKFQYNLAAFYYDYANIQVQITQAGSTISQNAAKARLYGLDIDTAVKATRNLNFRAGASLLHSEYTRYPNAATNVFNPASGGGVSGTIDADGESLVYAPSYSFTLGADYTAELPGGSSLVFAGNYYYAGKYKTVLGDLNYIKAYGNLNTSVTWNSPGEKYYVRVWGKNLTDQRDIGRYLNSFGVQRQLVRPLTFGVAIGFNLQ